ncbi:unnamed protein product [Rotaria sp. Silwood1]|nr:unnamed protein product [Rotaria sp. Silwood1]
MYDELIQAINGIDSDHATKIVKSDNLKTVSDEIILMVLYCLQPTVRSKISIFNFTKDEKLSEIILRSICKFTVFFSSPAVENKIQPKKLNSNKRDDMVSKFDYLLELALDWDCINTAKEWIVQDSLDNIYNRESIFCRALTKQRHKFVHYFIQLGLEIDEIFFHPKLNPFAARNMNKENKRYSKFLKILYTEEAINRDDWLLRDVVKTTNDQHRKVICSTDDLNRLFRVLVGGYMKPLYYDSQIEEQENRMRVKHFTNIIFPMEDIEQGQLIASDTVYKQLAKDYIIRDLFLWSIVMNYMDLAKVFLAHMKDRICGALIATEILSHLRDHSSDAVHGDKKTNLTYWINYFEQYAINCMDLCFKNDPNMARILAIQRVEMFGDVTCLQVCDDANSKRFASHPCCRQAENSIWYDKLHSDQFHLRYYIGQLIGLWTLGLLAPFTVRFQTVDQNPLPTEPIIIMGYDLWLWWMGSLSFIIVNPFLGPHLVSIGKMLKNLAFFAILIAIVMTAYGVASRSMAFYGAFEFSIRNVLRYVLYPVYYLLYTNVSGELNGLDESKHDSPSIATHILLAFHMLLINILLVNLLIAMFNKSFQDVQSIQSDIWNYQQYMVVREYYDRPPLFIPFSTIFDIITLMKTFYQWYLRVRYNYANPSERVFKVIAVQPELELAWQEFESASTYAYAQHEALAKIKRITIENATCSQESNTSGIRSMDDVESFDRNITKKETDAIIQLRNEFKAAIKDLRNDIRLITKQK